MKKKLNQFKVNHRAKLMKSKAKAENEGKVAYFCLHASRLYIQVASFIQESLHVSKQHQSSRKLCIASQCPEEPEREQFTYQGKDLFKTIRDDVIACRDVYQDYFKTSIPLLDEDGKLV